MISRSSAVSGPGLRKDAVRHSHLADVVKKSAARDMAQQGFVNAHRLRNRDRERSDALAMAFGFGVLGVQRAAQGFERVVVGLLEILQGDGKLLRAFGDQMLEIALVGAVFEHQAAMLQRAANAQIKLIFFEWLQNVVVSAGANGFEGDGNIVHGRDHDHGNVRDRPSRSSRREASARPFPA